MITMMDDVGRFALPERHVERIGHEISRHVFADRPADDTTTPHVEHGRQVDKAGPGRDVGQVGHPPAIRTVAAN